MTPKAYQMKWFKFKKYAIQRQEPTSNLKIDRSTAKRVKVASNAYLALIVAWLWVITTREKILISSSIDLFLSYFFRSSLFRKAFEYHFICTKFSFNLFKYH